ncbi:unnamed protein product [Rotaria sordida]|uniref:Uncharacterized protein n=1 Tax=Rotaria sordida TaxID=392033 RepID=A0A818SW73_9BILA|nr:unnamed protein product [Rotaria sordida]CAF3678242.1 unnamed protein product [Rotaria sordida]
MNIFTVTLVVLLVISIGHVYGHPAASLHRPIVDYQHGFKILQFHPLSNKHNHPIPSNINDANEFLLPYNDRPRKRLIDF